ncbi:hypothetical protein ACFLXM_01680 [Chloroflexota bacterium]
MARLGLIIIKRSFRLAITPAAALAQARVKLRNLYSETHLDLLRDEDFPYQKFIL